ncbi:MAG: thioredoxin domain-containing protein [Alphaproteobacteria bacterium]|nr:thioredoxin domain-containing protein [Alphaproteobacteria bacterium]
MIKNIVLGVLCLAIAFVGYQIFDAYRVRGALADVEAPLQTGPQDADLEVVEFLDYGCPYCREAHPTIMEAVQRDGRVRYIPRPVAFLGPESAYAAVVAYAAAQQDKFFEMHDALIRNFDNFNETTMPNIAAQAGADPALIQQQLDKGYLQEQVLENLDLFEAMGTNATPTFVIGGDMIYVPEGRMPSVDDFLEMFNKARGEAQ